MSDGDVPPPLERARAAMRGRGIDAVIAASPGLVAFLTGHVVPAHLAYPSRDGRLEKPTIVLVGHEYMATIGVDPRPEVGEAIAYGAGARGLADEPDQFSALAGAARRLGLGRGKVAAELAWVPAGAMAAFADALHDVRIEPLNDLLREAKAAKSPQEIEGIALASGLADSAHEAIRAAVAPGVSELELYAVAVEAMNARAGELVLSGCELQVGERGELMMGPPTGATVAEGELVMSDVYPRHPNGWWADSCSTVVCGQPTPEQRRDWQALYDGLRAGQELLKPGIRTGDVYAAVCHFAREQPGHAGHSIGRDHYEEPVIRPDNPEPLPPAAVIVLEPGRYGTGRGMRLEWAFEVTPDGGRPLTTFSLEL